MAYLLVHSPLTGPACWDGVRVALTQRGYQAQVAVFPPLTDPVTVAQAIADQAGSGTVVVLHSGAGSLAPAIADLSDGRVIAAAFVDAVLPHPGRSWFDTASAGLGQRLRDLVIDGCVPSWDQWFGEGAMAQLLPDPAQREAFERELTSTPVSWLEGPAPDIDFGLEPASAFLRLSKIYEDEAAEARHRGWPTLRLDLGHLALMTHPAEVVRSLIEVTKRFR